MNTTETMKAVIALLRNIPTIERKNLLMNLLFFTLAEAVDSDQQLLEDVDNVKQKMKQMIDNMFQDQKNIIIQDWELDRLIDP